uniref:NADH-ubiquinone oxidoreductase chain 6 n=1 Tax=Geisha distinctissima TaxID=130583 RepID=C3TX62_9HEMI|nr:NADH dehydrogenase subunit 6 [Geisha distinctissima]ACI28661.1 NADH dehydrogenase subunit 6 [Geisha distinctissima]
MLTELLKYQYYILTITPTTKHPMSMGSTLMAQTILIAMIMTKFSNSSWYSYILFITTVGGLMIMFMYMSSVASNEKFKPMKMKTMMILMMMILTMMMMKDNVMTSNQTMEMKKVLMNQAEELKSTSKFFNLNKMNTTIIMMTMLLITMISVTNISSSFEGPLKKTYV